MNNDYFESTPSFHRNQWLIQGDALRILLESLSNSTADPQASGYTKSGCAGHTRAIVLS
jgi:hypothetical protein